MGIAVTAELEIVFDTVTGSRKYRNLVANSHCSFVLGWEDEVTVQYEGEAFQPKGDDLARYLQIYFGTWPDGIERAATWSDIAYFAVRPRWIRYSDFDQRPPLIVEFRFAG